MTIPALERLNALAQKSKTGKLTDTELQEREILRKEYLAVIRGGFEEQLLTTKIVDAEGTDVTPFKLRATQAARRKKIN